MYEGLDPYLAHRLVAVLLLDCQQLCLLSGYLVGQYTLQRGQSSLGAYDILEGALMVGTGEA